MKKKITDLLLFYQIYHKSLNVVCNQINDYFDKILPKYQCAFRKSFCTQHCLLTMIEELQKSFDS